MSLPPTNSGPANDPQPANGWLSPGHPIDIPDHELLCCVGRGSYGEVWLARSVLGTYRAIKIIFRRAFENERTFERELTGIRKFEPISRSHEGFVNVLHIGHNLKAGYFFYVMEIGDDVKTGQKIEPATYVPKTLAKQISIFGRLPFDDCLQLGMTLAGALGHLHNQGLIHRDIKPSNIIFVNGKPKLADIGLVANIGEAKSLVGTPGFIAPEGANSFSSDIYSLGKVLYEAATGDDQKAFPVLPEGFSEFPDHPDLVELNDVATRACERDPKARYQTAREMEVELAILQSGRSVHRLRVLEHRWAKAKKAGLIALLLLVAGGVTVYPMVLRQREKAEMRQNRLGAKMAYGIRAMDDGDFIGSLPFFVEALELDQGFPKREDDDRLRIGSLFAHCPKPTQLWLFDRQINDTRFSPDGRQILAAVSGRNARVLDVDTGSTNFPAFGDNRAVYFATWSPDARFVLTCGQYNVATVFEAATGRELPPIIHPGHVTRAEFSPDGERFVTACGDHKARIYQTATGKLLFPLEYHSDMVWSAEFSRDGKRVVTASKDGSAVVWDAQTGKPYGTPMKHHRDVFGASFNPEGTKVVTAGFDGRARLWTVGGQELPTAMRHGDGVHSARFSPDGRYIVTAGYDSTVRLWDATTGGPARRNAVLKHSAKVMSASFSPDGCRIVTGCVDGTVRVWDLAASLPTPRPVPGVISPDGKLWAAPALANVQFGSTMINASKLPRITCAGLVEDVGFNANGGVALTISAVTEALGRTNKVLQVWDPRSGRQVSPRFNRIDSLSQTCASDDGRTLALWHDQFVSVLELSTGKDLYPPLHVVAEKPQLIFDHAATRLAVFAVNKAFVWDARTGKLCFPPLELAAGISHAEFSPDGTSFLTAITDPNLNERCAQIWNATTGQPVGRPLWHKDGVLDASFSFDGKRVVTASEDFTAQIWDATTGEPITAPLAHQDQVWGASFSPDGRWVATASLDKTARLWDATKGEPLTPPLEHPAGLASAIILGSREGMVTTAGPDKSWFWELRRDTHSLDELRILTQLLLGDAHLAKRGTLVENARALESAWRTLKARHPEDFTVKPSQIVAWHENEARRAKEDGDAFATKFHLDWLEANAARTDERN